MPRLCVISVTFYTDASDVRFLLAQQLCRLATAKQIHLIIVDGSPPEIQALLWQEQSEYVEMFRQDKEKFQGKGGSLRQAVKLAAAKLEAQGLKAAIAFTEPEKVDFINHVYDIAQPLLEEKADVVVPMRNKNLFQQTYPIEQYHSESFANLHFDSLAQQYGGFKDVKVDWTFGPFAFNATLAKKWLDYTGNSWDAQMVPYVRGVRNDGWRVHSVEVNFELPSEMKMQEEGNPIWSSKRLHQLNVLFELLGSVELS
jgi:hypothetical protein